MAFVVLLMKDEFISVFFLKKKLGSYLRNEKKVS